MENRRCAGGRAVQRPVLYLGEINDSQREAWIRSIEVFDEDHCRQDKLSLFASDRTTAAAADGIGVRLSEFASTAPAMGSVLAFQPAMGGTGSAGVLAWEAWNQPRRNRLGACAGSLNGLPAHRSGQRMAHAQALVCQSAMGDLLGEDFALADKDTLYRCLDLLLPHKRALFDHLTQRWRDLFGVKFEVLLYDLTSTYFESNPPFPENDKRRFGYSRDKRRTACRSSSP